MSFGFKKFEDKSNFELKNNFKNFENIPKKPSVYPRGSDGYALESEVKFYNQDSLWTRWRRGYELYTFTQQILGSNSKERDKRGDYRLFFTFQQFPGVFIPARIFTFPSTNQELGEHICGMRDTDGFSFYDFGLPILDVRYLAPSVNATYTQSGTTLVVTKNNHGLFPNDNVYLDISTGSATDETLTIISKTQNTFTLTASNSATTSGNVVYHNSTAFNDTRWRFVRVKLRSLPTEVAFLAGERMADRIVERDSGITSTYSRSGTTVTVTCSSAHGLSTDNRVFVDVSTGAVISGRYTIEVTSTTEFKFTTIPTGTTSGNLKLFRLIRGFRYDDYVGYTVTGSDATTNEIIFQKADSYGAKTVDTIAKTTVPAHRGFAVGRFLTTELRWNCSCQDFSRRDSYNLFSQNNHEKFPVTAIRDTKPGNIIQNDGSLDERRDEPGVFRDLGYVTINNFYELPEYEDEKQDSFQNLQYYQLRWCKHIYAAMWSILHDEGNEPLKLAAKYNQNGINITVDFENHNLNKNDKIQLNFTSGNAISGEYTITDVPSPNSFTVVYPFTQTTGGYVTVENLKKHEYVGAWLLEPSDKPLGKGYENWEKRWAKEKRKMQEAVEVFALYNRSTKWEGNKNIIGDFNLPQDVANFDPSVIAMTLTDSLKRDETGGLNREGKSLNTTNRMIAMVNKLFNKAPTVLDDIKFGIVNKPLSEFTNVFEAGLLKAGDYINGELLDVAANTSNMDAGSYNPETAQDTVVDAGLYINV
tara:strand:- start:7243 stop:9513 length:2271 start_codon:yes stop_codon:yes gene_type:complete